MSGERCAWCDAPATVGTSSTTPPLACRRHGKRLGKVVYHQPPTCGICQHPILESRRVADPMFGEVHLKCSNRLMKGAALNRHED